MYSGARAQLDVYKRQSILGGILLSFSPPAEATAQYSIIPEPSRTELKKKRLFLQLLQPSAVCTLKKP